eukprot:6096284-Prymnesium_polylepis.1
MRPSPRWMLTRPTLSRGAAAVANPSLATHGESPHTGSAVHLWRESPPLAISLTRATSPAVRQSPPASFVEAGAAKHARAGPRGSIGIHVTVEVQASPLATSAHAVATRVSSRRA